MPAEIHIEALTFPPESVCVRECMYMHIFLILKEEFCSVVAQRAWMLPEQPSTPAALLRIPHKSQIICPSVLKVRQSYSIQVYHSLNFFAVTGFNICESKTVRARTTQSDPTQTTVHLQTCCCTAVLACSTPAACSCLRAEALGLHALVTNACHQGKCSISTGKKKNLLLPHQSA